MFLHIVCPKQLCVCLILKSMVCCWFLFGFPPTPPLVPLLDKVFGFVCGDEKRQKHLNWHIWWEYPWLENGCSPVGSLGVTESKPKSFHHDIMVGITQGSNLGTISQ